MDLQPEQSQRASGWKVPVLWVPGLSLMLGSLS